MQSEPRRLPSVFLISVFFCVENKFYNLSVSVFYCYRLVCHYQLCLSSKNKPLVKSSSALIVEQCFTIDC